MQLFPQFRGTPFGPRLARELQDEAVTAVDVATAWVRASGLVHVQTGLIDALGRGAAVRVVVGIDADNTSEEGLRGLLEIADRGAPNQMRVYVRHNEAGPIFHPKLYVFRTADQVRAYIGSNNLTQSGLFQNDELSVRVRQPRGGQLDAQLEQLIRRVTRLEDPLNKRLTPPLLERLIGRGYIKAEARLIATQRARSGLARVKDPIFGSERRVPVRPALPAAPPVTIAATSVAPVAVRPDWHAVYLRVRLARGTQAQIPIWVVREIRRRMGLTPQDGTVTVRSRVTGENRGINPAYARGSLNTYKIEAREARGEPLLVIEPVGNTLFYEFLDATRPVGSEALRLLNEGFETDPPQTLQTAKDREHSTWVRFE
jgi:HKD family nuclease